MRIEKIKISYSTTIPIMSYGVNDKIGVEIEVDAESNPFDLEHLVTEHKANVDAIVRKLYPQYHQESSSQFANIEPIRTETSHEEIRIGDIENDIRSCTTIATLETYKLIVKSKPQFKPVYDEVYAKLSNQ